MSLGLTGYMAGVDRAWRDGALLAVAQVNRAGGVNGRPIEIISVDNKSTPQEAVTATQRLISSDKVQLLSNGCLSAGNLATVPIAARAFVPMIICTPIPDAVAAGDREWLFSTFPPVAFDVANHIAFLKARGIRRIGILKDPTPSQEIYATVAGRLARAAGLHLVAVEEYKQGDADLTVQIGNLYAKGAQAVLKYGAGPSNLVAARNIKQLSLPLYLVVNVQDGALFSAIAAILGDHFAFGVLPAQAPQVLADGALKSHAATFLRVWNAVYPGRDPGAGSRGWDSIFLAYDILKRAKRADGPAIRAAIQGTTLLVGSAAVYSFGSGNHTGVQENPYSMAQIAGGRMRPVL